MDAPTSVTYVRGVHRKQQSKRSGTRDSSGTAGESVNGNGRLPDWMARNLYQRVEVLFPVLDPALRRRIRHEILEAFLRDTLKARLLRADATYVRADAGRRKAATAFSAQDFFIGVAEGKANTDSIPRVSARGARRALASEAE